MQHKSYLSTLLPLEWWVTIQERKLQQQQRLKGILFIFPPISLQTLKEASSKRVCTAFILYNALSISSLISLRQRWQWPASFQQHKKTEEIHGEEGQSTIFYCWLNINNCLIDTKPHLLTTSIHWNLLFQWQIRASHNSIETWKAEWHHGILHISKKEM